MSNNQGKPQIFFSHAHEDADFAIAVKTWLDEVLLGTVNFFVSSDKGSANLGQEWPKLIRESLELSSIVLVLVSPASVDRRWIYFEAGAGYIRGVPVIPICVGGMKVTELSPPLSLLQSIQLPNKESAHQLLDLVASSAGVRTPKLYADLELPDRTVLPANKADDSIVQMQNRDTPWAENLSISNARKMMREADPQVVAEVRALVMEALFVSEIHTWSGNRDDVQGVLSELRSRLSHPVLLKKDDAAILLAKAEEAAKSWNPPQKAKDDSSFDSSGYDHVRVTIAPIIGAYPSISEYMDSIFRYAPEIYVPILLTEVNVSGNDSTRWAIFEILSNSGYGQVILPFLSQVLSERRPGYWDFRYAVQIARNILLDKFDDWYRSIRGCSYAEDIQRQEERDKREREEREKEYQRMRELDRPVPQPGGS